MNKELKISARRLKELERMGAKLNALESGGVDNWDYYDDALKDYHLENKKDELIEKLIYELADGFGQCAYEPSERGAGIAFSEDVAVCIVKILESNAVTFSNLGEE